MHAEAFATIFDDKRRVLLCRRRDIDAWNLPGGGVEAGETPWHAAVREVREEVGLEWRIADGPAVFRTQTGLSMRDRFGARKPA
jgi:ADP-ribose pyrophosphatase YjhB (NUDIX family)